MSIGEQGLAKVTSATEMRKLLVDKSAKLLVAPTNTETYVLIHAVHAVRFGLRTGSGLDESVDEVLDPALLQEVRIFNESGELHLWRTDKGFAWRTLQDGTSVEDSDETHFRSDYTYFLWGNHLGSDGHTLADRDRGMQITLPIVGEADTPAHATYTVRNYLGYDDSGQVQLLNARLVSLAIKKGR
jgi:CRISPR-associated protein (TIGR03984 family)